MLDLAASKRQRYIQAYNAYLASINTQEERPFNKVATAKLAREAKKSV